MCCRDHPVPKQHAHNIEGAQDAPVHNVPTLPLALMTPQTGGSLVVQVLRLTHPSAALSRTKCVVDRSPSHLKESSDE
jgi:hypothetical protein